MKPRKTKKKKGEITLVSCYGCGQPFDKDDLEIVWKQPYGLYCKSCLAKDTDERTGLAEGFKP